MSNSYLLGLQANNTIYIVDRVFSDRLSVYTYMTNCINEMGNFTNSDEKFAFRFNYLSSVSDTTKQYYSNVQFILVTNGNYMVGSNSSIQYETLKL